MLMEGLHHRCQYQILLPDQDGSCVHRGRKRYESEIIKRKIQIKTQRGSHTIAYLEELYTPHPLVGVMAQNTIAAAKKDHVWSTGNQII